MSKKKKAKVTTIDRIIVAIAKTENDVGEFCAQLPVKELAEKTGFNASTIRKAVKKDDDDLLSKGSTGLIYLTTTGQFRAKKLLDEKKKVTKEAKKKAKKPAEKTQESIPKKKGRRSTTLSEEDLAELNATAERLKKRPNFKARVMEGTLFIIRPQLTGGYHYSQSKRKETTPTEEDPSLITTYEAEATIDNVIERRGAYLIYNRSKTAGRKYGFPSIVGFIIPRENVEALDKRLEEIQAEAKTFNASAKSIEVRLDWVKFPFTNSNQQCSELLIREMRNLMEELANALDEASPKKIKNVLVKAIGIKNVVDTDTCKLMGETCDWAKAQAKYMVQRLKEVEGDVNAIKKEFDGSPIRMARFAFVE